MSRILGLVREGPAAGRGRLLDDMFERARVRPGWARGVGESADASLGWCGWREPNVAVGRSGAVAVVDGVLYNRDAFEPAATEAQVVLHLYERCGFAAALRQLNGDFAVALFDPRTATLCLARDRFGVRPLYYVVGDGVAAFASQPRALFAVPGVSRTPNRRFVALFAASHYRYFDNDPGASPFEDIAQVPAAHHVVIRNGAVSSGAYWMLEDGEPAVVEDEAVLAEQCRDLLLDAVRRRLGDGAGHAFTLSGGMDSSSVLSSAVHLRGERFPAFSSVYDDTTYDESADIETILPATVSRWHRVRVAPPDLEAIVSDMIAVHDEPVATATWLSHYLVCREAAANGVRVMFGGLGGDELNAGEYEYFPFFFADVMAAGDTARLEREIDGWVRHHDHPVFRKTPARARELVAALTDPDRPGHCRPDRQRLARYARVLNPGVFDLDGFEPVMEHPFRSCLKNRCYQDLTRETLPCCLRAEDRQYTAFGIDHRLPFLDHRLVEFMFRVPVTLEIRDGVTKRLLREAMAGIVPDTTRLRIKKTGWNAPAHRWFCGDGRTLLLDLVGSASFAARGIYDVAEVRRLIDEHDRITRAERPIENHMMFLWQLLNLELWLRHVEAC